MSKPGARAVALRTFSPEPGTEADSFREVVVFVDVDFDHGMVVEPDPTDDNVLCGIPRVFYPPDGNGIEETQHLRPPAPARAIRWVVRCRTGGDGCMQVGDHVVIRPKSSDDPWCAPAEREHCPHMGDSREAARASAAQLLTLFSPASGGTYVIPALCGPGGCRPGSATSGFPNPVFPSGVTDLMWSYQVELWRHDRRVGCLDPDVWIEKDNN